jgi:hypothetical protein
MTLGIAGARILPSALVLTGNGQTPWARPRTFHEESVRVNFQPYEGKQIDLPHRFTPDSELLNRHRRLFSNPAASAASVGTTERPKT